MPSDRAAGYNFRLLIRNTSRTGPTRHRGGGSTEQRPRREIRVSRCSAPYLTLPARLGANCVAVLLNLHVDEIECLRRIVEETPTFHPIVSALQFGQRDWRRINQVDTALA